ncbi:MAG: hypothetical protein CSA63_00390 [Propionibacterium sp.]|nr:MAG: hypothetical protein CSA63_00390 [Propionibacterium sp.]
MGRLNQQAQNARNEAERTSAAIADATTQRAELAEKLADLTSRLELASGESEIVDPDRTARDELATAARQARAAEMDARLAVRTVEERIRAVKGRVESLETARQRATEALSAAKAAAERRRADAETATKVAKAVDWLRIVLDGYRREADVVRAAAEAERNQAEQAVRESRAATRQAESDLAEISSGAHKEEMARIEQRMRIESLTARAQNELGVTADELLAEYHPALPVPVFVTEDGLPVPADGPQPEPVPYVRGEQEKRLKEAERNLSVLGRVNPLAMEEFDALQERHQFLAEQYDDLVKTKADLVDMIQEVDSRVQEVFSSAFEDVAKAFERVFDRLFPGGAGRLVLTEPNDLLVTGVEVEARPPGKKIKRLSLLSGGERSLVAVAFLVSLFLARPSPFYILDEVEAALDDTNLGRLLEIYQELRENSQLLVITHQKRTMEIADSLYGVSMRGDGVTTVISQRLRDG